MSTGDSLEGLKITFKNNYGLQERSISCTRRRTKDVKSTFDIGIPLLIGSMCAFHRLSVADAVSTNFLLCLFVNIINLVLNVAPASRIE